MRGQLASGFLALTAIIMLSMMAVRTLTPPVAAHFPIHDQRHTEPSGREHEVCEGGGTIRDPRSMGIENVFIIVIDGLRYSESFGDPAHQYIPRIWNDLRPLGTIYTGFFNQGYTLTSASHATITSGVSQFMPNAIRQPGEDTRRIMEEPSIFQYYRSQLDVPADKTWIVNGKGKLLTHIGICQNPRYRNFSAPRIAFEYSRPDSEAWSEARRIIDVHRPSLMLINLRDVDLVGHTGVWNDYVDAIKKADGFVYDLCCRILLDPHYKEKTAVIITGDHGRHLEGISTGFKDHGCSCRGCRHVPFMALGHNIRADAVIERNAQLADIAPTVAAMLGFEAVFHRGRVLHDMFENPPAVETASFEQPAAESAGPAIHLAYRRSAEGRSQIFYTRSLDGGSSWPERMILGTAPVSMGVNLAASGWHVAAAWNRYDEDGICSIAVRESTDGGLTWSPVVDLGGNEAVLPDYYPDLCYRDGLLNVVWMEKHDVHMAVLKNHDVLQTDSFFEFTAFRPRCAAGEQGTHVVYQRYIPDNKNWDIAYCLHDASGWRAPIQLCATPGDSLRPDVAVDTAGVHVVWAERDGGVFRIVNVNSPDGTVWDAGRVVGEAAFGAWHPRITTTGNGLLVVWEGYTDSNPALFAAKSLDGGQSWSKPVRLTKSVRAETFPALTVDSKDILHLFWMRSPQPSSIIGLHHRL